MNSLKMFKDLWLGDYDPYTFHGYANVVIYGKVTIEGWILNSYLTTNAASH